jgi:hypothetical protein
MGELRVAQGKPNNEAGHQSRVFQSCSHSVPGNHLLVTPSCVCTVVVVAPSLAILINMHLCSCFPGVCLV